MKEQEEKAQHDAYVKYLEFSAIQSLEPSARLKVFEEVWDCATKYRLAATRDLREQLEAAQLKLGYATGALIYTRNLLGKVPHEQDPHTFDVYLMVCRTLENHLGIPQNDGADEAIVQEYLKKHGGE